MNPAQLFCLLLLLLHAVCATAQENTNNNIEIKRFDYVVQRNMYGAPSGTVPPLTMITHDSVQQTLKRAFVSALNNLGYAVNDNFDVKIKRQSIMMGMPELKTKPRGKDPNKQYLYIVVLDRTSYYTYINDTLASLELNVEYRLENGKIATLAPGREVSVKIYRNTCPGTQASILQLPAFPPAFTKAFDSIAAWTFSKESTTQKLLHLPSACAYQPDTTNKILRESALVAYDNKIEHTAAPSFTFYTVPVKRDKTRTRKNVGGNTVGGALTLITGISSNKKKIHLYTADHSFLDNQNSIHCFIDYREIEVAHRERTENEDGSYSTSSGEFVFGARQVDPDLEQFVTMNQDTVARFRLSYHNVTGYPELMWNGTDSASVTNTPAEFGTMNRMFEAHLQGTLDGKHFAMYTTNGMQLKQFWLDHKPVALISGMSKPVSVTFYQDVSEIPFKVFVTLASLPYQYFHETSAQY